MKKLLLAAALLTSVASAQFIEQSRIDPMNDKTTYFSLVKGIVKIDGKENVANFRLACLKEEVLAVVINNESDGSWLPKMDTVEIRVLPDDRQVDFDVVVDWGEVFLVNPKADSIDQLGSSEVRVRYEDSGGRSHFYSFNIPDVKESEAYKVCKER